jgi:hypothetical protein
MFCEGVHAKVLIGCSHKVPVLGNPGNGLGISLNRKRVPEHLLQRNVVKSYGLVDLGLINHLSFFR